MFERFTDRARRVVVLAQEEARLLGHEWIGTEHVLLGLIHEKEGVAATALEEMGVSLDAVRAKVESIIGVGDRAPSGHIPFTPRSKKLLELSLREALQLGHNYIGTEHILLGLIREGEGVAAQVLVSLGADLPAVREAVLRHISGPGTGRGRGRRPSPPIFVLPKETPAVTKAAAEARRLAKGGPVASHHQLLALLADVQSMAAKALAELGVTREAVEQQLGELDTAGTSDETPEEAGARRIRMRVQDQLLTLEIDDPELAASLEQAMAGRTARFITGTDPEATGFPTLWSAVSRTVDDLTRRLGPVASGRARRGPTGDRPATGEWRPPGWHEGGHTGVYWVASTATGMVTRLETEPGADRGALRRWLHAWLSANGPGLQRGGERDRCCALWAYVDRDGDTFRMTSFGFGADGPAGAAPGPLSDLLEVALADLASAEG